MYKTSLSIALLAMSSSVFASQQNQSEFDSTGVKKMRINNDSGDIIIEGQEPGSKIRVVASPSRPDCQQTIEIKDDTFVIENNKNKGGCDCHYSVLVPNDIDIESTTGSVNYTVSNMTRKFRATSGSATIKTNSPFSDVKIDSGSGDVDLDNLNSNVKLSGGSLQARLRYSQIPTTPVDITYSSGTGQLILGIPSSSTINFGKSRSLTSQFVNSPTGYNFRVNFSSGMGQATINRNNL